MSNDEQKKADLYTEAHRLVRRNWDDERIFLLLGLERPEVFEDEETREFAYKNFTDAIRRQVNHLPVPPMPVYDPHAANHLNRIIHQARKDVAKEIAREQRFDDIIGEAKVVSLAEVQETYTRRFSTDCHEIDRVFGCSLRYDDDFNVVGEDWGIARGKLALMGGEEGVGKTRWYTAMIIRMVVKAVAEGRDFVVAVFQGEMSPPEYKELLVGIARASRIRLEDEHFARIFVLPCRHLHEQTNVLRHGLPVKQSDGSIVMTKPDWAIVDSFPMIHGARTVDGIEEIVFTWKAVMGEHTAALFIAHLNEKKQIKGNNLIRYLVDSWYVMCLEPLIGDGYFSLTSGKNRQGLRNVMCFLRHLTGQVEVVPGWGRPEYEEYLEKLRRSQESAEEAFTNN